MFLLVPFTYNTRSESYDVDDFNDDPYGCSMHLERHHFGKLSIAAVQGNAAMEDYSQVEDGHEALFFGLYDGHRGTEAAKYMSTHLFPNLLNNFSRHSAVNAMRLAINETTERFMNVVERDYINQPTLLRVGSSCLAGYIYRGRFLYFANLGDSRAVIGCKDQTGSIIAEQLTTDSNGTHHDDHHSYLYIVLRKLGAWLVKGINKLRKSIRDVYLKKLPFTHVDFSKFGKAIEPFRQPVVSGRGVLRRILCKEDKFLIIASHGFWDFLSNEEAKNIVCDKPRFGIAKRLLRKALDKAAEKRKVSYEVLQNQKNRRVFHDDITVIVIFLDSQNPFPKMDQVSFRFRDITEAVMSSKFSTFNHDTIRT